MFRFLVFRCSGVPCSGVPVFLVLLIAVRTLKLVQTVSEHLSVDTLRRVPRVLNNYLSRLKINCDYAIRGCREFTSVENLTAHVANCGFAPVLCSNAECGVVISKQEIIHHETVLCEYRNVNYYGCGQIRNEVGVLKGSLIYLLLLL